MALSPEDSKALAYGNDVLTYPDGELGLKADKWVRVQITVISLRATCEYPDDFQTYNYWNIFRVVNPGTYYVSSFNAVKTVIAPVV